MLVEHVKKYRSCWTNWFVSLFYGLSVCRMEYMEFIYVIASEIDTNGCLLRQNSFSTATQIHPMRTLEISLMRLAHCSRPCIYNVAA